MDPNKYSTRIPRKFAKAKQTFIGRLANDVQTKHVTSFSAFPDKVSFDGQEETEHVVLLVRQHWAAFIPQVLGVLILLLMPIIFFAFVSALGDSFGSSAAIGLGGAVLFFLMAITLAVDTFFKWFYSVNLITDQRVIDVDFTNIMYHRFSEAQLEKIEDVSHSTGGVLQSFFDFGTVYLQTAGTKPEFEFNNVPRPRDIQDTLNDLLEMKQQGQI